MGLRFNKAFGFMSAATIVAESARACVRLLYPPHCNWCGAGCGDDDRLLLCCACQRLFAPAGALPRCRRCAARLPNLVRHGDGCGNCQKWRRPQFSRAFTVSSYSGATRSAILRIKQAREEPLAWSLGKLLAQSLASDLAAA